MRNETDTLKHKIKKMNIEMNELRMEINTLRNGMHLNQQININTRNHNDPSIKNNTNDDDMTMNDNNEPKTKNIKNLQNQGTYNLSVYI